MSSADIRDIDGDRRDAVVAAVLNSAKEIAEKRKVRFNYTMINQDPPATCSETIQSAISKAAEGLGYSQKSMVSRAYHDSLFMARVAPTGMIFIPCRGGWSHRPDEFASEEHIGKGVEVLGLTMAELSGGTWEDAQKARGKDEL